LNNITAPDEILPQQLPFDPNSFKGVPIDAMDGFTYTKNPITGKWTKTKTVDKIPKTTLLISYGSNIWG
jgi:hypothetical protein